MFINRVRELKFLEEKLRSRNKEVLVLWGRRRVGKTFLLKEFSKKHGAIYYLATRTSVREQLKELASIFAGYFNDSFLKTRSFGKWLDVFEYIKDKTSEQKIVWIIDEFPYLMEADSSIASVFQKGIDEYLYNKNILLILNGSSVSMMEQYVLGIESPLYGRRTGQWKIEPMGLTEFKDFFPRKNTVELINFYAVLGGIPFYANIFNPDLSLFGNLKEKVLKKGELLYEEVNFLLREEMRDPRVYFPILSSIAEGNHKFGDIASKTGLDKSNLTKYLSVLEDLHFIYRDIPVLEKSYSKSKKGLYFINDNFSDFWFYFIRPNLNPLEREEYDEVLTLIKKNFDFYVSQRVGKIIFQILNKRNQENSLFFKYDFLGRQWGRDYEMDILAFDKNRTKFLCGEIKWTNKKTGTNVLNELKKRVNKLDLPEDAAIFYILVSKNGFAHDLKSEAKKTNVQLIDLSKETKKA